MEEITNNETKRDESVEVISVGQEGTVTYLDKSGHEMPDLIQKAMEVAVLRCKKHPRMRGLRRPRNRCEKCLAIYEFTFRTGVKEKRRRKKNAA